MEKVKYLIIALLSIVQVINCDIVIESNQNAKKTTPPTLEVPLDTIPLNTDSVTNLRLENNIGKYNFNGNLENPNLNRNLENHNLNENQPNNLKLAEIRKDLSRSFFVPNQPPIFQPNWPGFVENRPIYQPNYYQSGGLEQTLYMRPSGYYDQNGNIGQNIIPNPNNCITDSGLGHQVSTQSSFNRGFGVEQNVNSHPSYNREFAVGQNVYSQQSYNKRFGLEQNVNSQPSYSGQNIITHPNYNGGLGQNVNSYPSYGGGLDQNIINHPSYGGGLEQNVINRPSHNGYYYPKPCIPNNNNGYIYTRPSKPFPSPSQPTYTTSTPFPPATARLIINPYKK